MTRKVVTPILLARGAAQAGKFATPPDYKAYQLAAEALGCSSAILDAQNSHQARLLEQTLEAKARGEANGRLPILNKLGGTASRASAMHLSGRGKAKTPVQAATISPGRPTRLFGQATKLRGRG